MGVRERSTTAHGTMTGTIKRLQADKGYGFIKGTDGQDYFFHRSSAPEFDHCREGYAVTFTPTPGQDGKGPRAADVTLAD